MLPVGVARATPDGARPVRPVRADPRLRAGHRRPGPREPARHDPVGGDAAALVARPRASGAATSRRRSSAALDAGFRTARPAAAGRRSDRRASVVGTREMTAAVVERLTAGRGGVVTEPPTARPRDARPKAGDCRSSSTTRPSATAPRARTSRSRWPTSCASRACSTSTACPTSRAAGRARTRRTSSSSRPPRTIRWPTREARRLRLDAPPLEPAEADPNLQELVARRDAGRHDLRQELAAPRHRGAGRDAGREPGHDRRLASRFIVERGREVVYDAEHFFDGYRADRDYALVDAPGRPRRRARGRSSCATRTAARSPTSWSRSSPTPRRARGATRDAPAPSPGASTPTTTPSWRSPTRSPPSQAGVRHVQATINGYGERCGNANMVAILANLALKTDLALLPAGGGELAELTELSPLRRGDRQRRPERLPAVRRALGVRPQGRRPRRRRGQGRAELPAHRPGRGRQRRPARRVASSAAGRTPRSGPQQLGHQLDGRHRPGGAVDAHQAARERGPRVRGRRGVASSC